MAAGVANSDSQRNDDPFLCRLWYSNQGLSLVGYENRSLCPSRNLRKEDFGIGERIVFT